MNIQEIPSHLLRTAKRIKSNSLVTQFKTALTDSTNYFHLYHYIKTLLKNNKLVTLGFLFLGYLLFKWKKDKKLNLHFKRTERNLKTITAIEDVLHSYSPTFWLPGALLKGAYIAYLGKIGSSDEFYRREKFELEDGEVIALDFHPKDYEILHPRTPTVVFIPGIMGDSLDKYSIEFCEQVSKILNWRTCVVNRRGYGGMSYKGERLSCFLSLKDLSMLRKKINENFPQSNVYLTGVSMGGFQTHKFLQSFEGKVEFKAACAIGSFWDSFISSRRVASSYIAERVLTEQFKRHVRSHQEDPYFDELLNKRGVGSGKNLINLLIIIVDEVLRFDSKIEFDKHYLAKDLGVDNELEYYYHMDLDFNTHKVEIPLLSINSADDMFCPKHSIPVDEIRENPNFIQIITNGGGHIEFCSGIIPKNVSFFVIG